MEKVLKRKKTVSVVKEPGSSTRQVILTRANEIINEVGMVDFRIDALATSLGLSPGNITYHFPKKEDIGNAIWEQSNKEIIAALDHYITPLLDIKQLYLFYKFLVSHLYKYKGVVCYKLGDLGLLHKGKEDYVGLAALVKEHFSHKMAFLANNGYLVPIKDKGIMNLVYEAQLVCLGWWNNHAIATGKPEEDMNAVADKYALIILYPLTPFLTEQGKKQYNGILSLIQK